MVTSSTVVCPVWVYHRDSPGRPRTRLRATKEDKTELRLPPASKQEAIQQARDSLWHVLESPLRKRLEPAPIRKSSKKQQQEQQESRFRIEIPVADESDQALASLALELLENAGVSKVCIVSGSPSVRELLKKSSRLVPRLQICSPEEDLAVDRDAAFILVLVPSEVEAVKRILTRSGKRPLVLVNPEWSEEEEAQEISKSFQVAYSFTPLEIQALFFQKIQGAVLKQVPVSTPWRIFVQEDELNCVSSLNKRPTNADLEDALYNRVAARSPLVKSVKFLKGLIKWPGNSGKR